MPRVLNSKAWKCAFLATVFCFSLFGRNLIAQVDTGATGRVIARAPQETDWPTFAHDPQRSGWASGKTALSPANASRLQLLWKVNLKNQPRSLAALTAAVTANGVATSTGIRNAVYVAGSSDEVYALDAGTGKILWNRNVANPAIAPAYPSSWACPNNLNATPTIDKERGLIYVLSAEGVLYGLDLGSGKVRFGPVQFVPPFSKAWSLTLWDGVVYTAISQHCGGAPSGVYAMDIRDPRRPVIRGMLLQQGFGAGIWGRGGVAIGQNGRIYAATGDGTFDPAAGDYGSSVVALSPGSLEVLDYYSPKNHAELTRYDLDVAAASPVWFRYRNFSLLAGGGKEGILYLLNADSLGGMNHDTALDEEKLANDRRQFEENGIWGALSTRTDAKGEVWLYVPVWGPVSKQAPVFPISYGPHLHGAVMAFRVVLNQATGKPRLQPAWVSRDFDVPEPVALAGGLAFVLSTGENTHQVLGASVVSKTRQFGTRRLSSQERMENTGHAILYALDARTGKVLYSSGSTIETWTHFSGLAIADSRIYAVDHGSTLYCFGLSEP